MAKQTSKLELATAGEPVAVIKPDQKDEIKVVRFLRQINSCGSVTVITNDPRTTRFYASLGELHGIPGVYVRHIENKTLFFVPYILIESVQLK